MPRVSGLRPRPPTEQSQEAGQGFLGFAQEPQPGHPGNGGPGPSVAYRDRRQKKRQMRRLWIVRINAAARLNDISYSRLMAV